MAAIGPGMAVFTRYSSVLDAEGSPLSVRDALAAFRIGAWMFKEGHYITQYDHHIAAKLAYVMCGGELTRPQWVSEQYILDLEREAFLSLCGEEKTQARMWSLLQTGKPLRN